MQNNIRNTYQYLPLSSLATNQYRMISTSKKGGFSIPSDVDNQEEGKFKPTIKLNFQLPFSYISADTMPVRWSKALSNRSRNEWKSRFINFSFSWVRLMPNNSLGILWWEKSREIESRLYPNILPLYCGCISACFTCQKACQHCHLRYDHSAFI